MAAQTAWWRDAVIYEIYVRSFADSNADGVGDLNGIQQRLPYLRDLGVDAIWLTPFYVSPMTDGGYDVADHRDVDPLFGSLRDFDALLASAHDHGLRVIVDVVPNHTSDRHPWFVEALAAGPGDPQRDRYIFRPGRGANGELPPNDWESIFGGPAWTQVDAYEGNPGEWYLHLFDSSQPDLNWESAEVRNEYADVLRFWLDRGVDGFRIDVAHGLVKDPNLPDVGGSGQSQLLGTEQLPYFDQDGVHDVYREWRKILDSYPGERAAVAEAWAPGPERLARYIRPDELHQVFNFQYLTTNWNSAELRRVINSSLAAAGSVAAPSTWVLSNHDVVRHATRFGTGDTGLKRARAATLLMLALPGSAYLYQGEELGLPEVTDLPEDSLQDPVWERSGHTERGRDGCRVPLPWEQDAPDFGFGSADVQAWLPMPESWRSFAVSAQAGVPGSTLSMYRSALRLRQEHPALGDGDLTWLDIGGDGVLAFGREPGFVCVLNMGEQPVTLSDASALLLSSGPVRIGGSQLFLPQDTAVWLDRSR